MSIYICVFWFRASHLSYILYIYVYVHMSMLYVFVNIFLNHNISGSGSWCLTSNAWRARVRTLPTFWPIAWLFDLTLLSYLLLLLNKNVHFPLKQPKHPSGLLLLRANNDVNVIYHNFIKMWVTAKKQEDKTKKWRQTFKQ